MNNLKNWTEFTKLIPKKFKETKNLKRSGIAGLFAASLELSREGILSMRQKKSFDKILIKGRNE